MYNLGNAKTNQLGSKEEKNKYATDEYIIDINSQNDSHSIIAREILKSAKKEIKVLDIGCGSGVIGDFFENEKRIILDGIEIDEKAREELIKKGRYRNIFSFSIETISSRELKEKLDKYDFIILADLLEHLVKPYEIIENLTTILKPDGNMLISIPNIAHIDVIKNLINNKFNYNDVGTLDTTHLRFYTLKSFGEMIQNINKNCSKQLDLVLIGKTKTYPDDIDYTSDLFNTLNENDNVSVLQYIMKVTLLKKDEKSQNLNKIIKKREKDIYNLLNSKVESTKNLIIDNQKLFEENTHLLQDNDSLLEELLSVRKEKEEFKNAVTDMMNSASWKITEPIRKSKEVLSNIKNKATRVNAKIKVSIDNSNNQQEENIIADPIFKRTDINEIVSVLKNYDIISFDVFDTLILRTVVNPTDVFQLMGIYNKMESFGVNRVKAELEARKKTSKKNFEINIEDIYNELQNYLTIDKNEFIKKELEMEKKICFANPYMQEIFKLLKKAGKKIIITSDMYWPKSYLQEILSNCGYEGFEEIFVSCDYEMNKGNGSIQKMINEKFPKQSIVHIGDNFKSDIEGSKKAGWNSYHYRKCKEIAEKLHDPVYDHSLIDSITSALRFNYLYAGDKKFSKYYKYGFKYGGILVCGFMEYLNKIAKENKIDKILFLARDSKIFYEVYNKFYKEYENDYVIVSRSAMYEANFENNVEEFIDFYFKYRASIGKITCETVLKETDLGLLVSALERYNLNASEYLTIENFANLKRLIYDHKEIIATHFKTSKEAAIKYFKHQTKGCKKVLAVDLGWSGSIVSLMRNFFKNNIDENIELLGAFIGNKDSQKVNYLVDLGIFNPFCFSYKDSNMKIDLDSWDGSMQAIFVEAMFTSNEPTLLKYEKDAFVYGNITSNEKILNEIHKGIMDFVNLYVSLAIPGKENLAINSNTAFTPLHSVLKNYRYNYEIFKNFKEFQDSLPRFNTDREITTIGQIMKNRNFM